MGLFYQRAGLREGSSREISFERSVLFGKTLGREEPQRGEIVVARGINPWIIMTDSDFGFGRLPVN